jgi:hypothetical protein
MLDAPAGLTAETPNSTPCLAARSPGTQDRYGFHAAGTLPLSDNLQQGGLRRLARNSAERALLARLELTAFQQAGHGARFEAGHGESMALWLPTRLFGLRLGLVEGVSFRADWQPDCVLELATQSGSTIGQFMTTPDRGVVTDNEPLTVPLAARRGWLLARTRTRLREVMHLAPAYEETLEMLGRHTRRNIRNTRKFARASGLAFKMWHGGAGIATELRVALGRKTEPYPLVERRMRPLEQYADAAGRSFRSAMVTEAGEVISYACGFIDQHAAYLVYQLNSSEWAKVGPSLMHRAYLLEALVELGCKELVFIHGCSGVLSHACTPMTLDRYLVVRDTAVARAAATLIVKLYPTSRLGKLLDTGGRAGAFPAK